MTGDEDGIYIAIENGIDSSKKADICYVIIQHKEKRVEGESFGIALKEEIYNKLLDTSKKTLGFNKTYGELVNESHPEIPKDNWMASPLFGNHDRKDQIVDALRNSFSKFSG